MENKLLIFKREQLLSLANFITITRIALSIPIVSSLAFNKPTIAWCLIILACFSDIADGWVARKAGGGTSFGAIIDPLADKILLTAPLIWFVSKQILPFWAVWTLILRELFISGWRNKKIDGGPASRGGKIKTMMQFCSVILIMWPPYFGNINLVSALNIIGYWMFWLSFLLALITAVNYLKD